MFSHITWRQILMRITCRPSPHTLFAHSNVGRHATGAHAPTRILIYTYIHTHTSMRMDTHIICQYGVPEKQGREQRAHLPRLMPLHLLPSWAHTSLKSMAELSCAIFSLLAPVCATALAPCSCPIVYVCVCVCVCVCACMCVCVCVFGVTNDAGVFVRVLLRVRVHTHRKLQLQNVKRGFAW